MTRVKAAIVLKLFCLPSEKKYTLKGKYLLHMGANLLAFKVDTFSEMPCCAESKQEITKVVSLVKMA